ncbi:hypothetical protein AB0952_08760 [Streptomyces caniferus]|uniref:hypothetical protein n=1 Tax=Streptomyces caniferus TaxID=285557 RepID=UPI0034560D23
MAQGGKEEGRVDRPMRMAVDAPKRAHQDSDVDGYRDAGQAIQLGISKAIGEGLYLVIVRGIAEGIAIGIAIRASQGT